MPICDIGQRQEVERLALCGLLLRASHIIRSNSSKQHEPGPFIIGILKSTHIGHVLIVARQATLDWFPCGGINPFLHCGKWCGVIGLDITEYFDRNQTITIRRLREQRSIAKDCQTSDTERLGMSRAGPEVFSEELLLFRGRGAIA